MDSPDLSLNISREVIQQNRILKTIESNIEKKIKSSLLDMLKDDRETYEKFFRAFGMQLKFGVYNEFGADKDKVVDLLMFYSSHDKKYTTLDEYVSRMKEDQDTIYYACGETIDKIESLPQVDSILDKGYEILYLTEYVDEFALQTLISYKDKKFVNVSDASLDLDSDSEKEEVKKINEDNKDMFTIMKEAIPNVKEIRFTNKLKKHPVCLTTEGNISIEMEKVINAMPTDEKINASLVLEINKDHEIVKKLEELYNSDKEKLKEYSKILYSQARLIEGLSIENPTEISNLICEYLSK